MEIPVIDLKGLTGDNSDRSRTMAQLHEACKDWGFFWLENHGVDAAIMEDVKRFVHGHYEEHLEGKFYASDLAKNLDAAAGEAYAQQVDWEAAYSIQHFPKPTSPTSRRSRRRLGTELLDTYIAQTVSLAELLPECMSLNLGLDAGHIKTTLAAPSVGTKFAMYPACPRPELDEGFLKGGTAEWVHMVRRVFVNIGDQIKVISGGVYRSGCTASPWEPAVDGHVLQPWPGCRGGAGEGGGAGVPGPYRFGDYLEYYQRTKFGDKAAGSRPSSRWSVKLKEACSGVVVVNFLSIFDSFFALSVTLNSISVSCLLVGNISLFAY
ncbi:1-aminocyclopropane-1-carboxylate oxidase 1 [Dichanthelium oligosanthes]|uniref:1-aminocyclopropane-1-carboxylate oxidase 1 n=1 Tax=Dichanthelium oligosanthes TaxID=888268 RepID=A0A1E5UNT1_9POAL|nr:1-aminocyclopropane-1-carboxylate oxidase 1 [Dichanthelium oligosanthes]